MKCTGPACCSSCFGLVFGFGGTVLEVVGCVSSESDEIIALRMA